MSTKPCALYCCVFSALLVCFLFGFFLLCFLGLFLGWFLFGQGVERKVLSHCLLLLFSSLFLFSK